MTGVVCGPETYINWWKKPEYPEKAAFLSQVTDKLDNIKLHRVHLAWAGFELTTLLVIGTDRIGILNSGRAPINNISKIKRYTFIFWKLGMNILEYASHICISMFTCTRPPCWSGGLFSRVIVNTVYAKTPVHISPSLWRSAIRTTCVFGKVSRIFDFNTEKARIRSHASQANTRIC